MHHAMRIALLLLAGAALLKSQPYLASFARAAGTPHAAADSDGSPTLAAQTGLSRGVLAAAWRAGRQATTASRPERLVALCAASQIEKTPGFVDLNDRWGVLPVAFSPDGQTLASGVGDGTVRLWDLKSGQGRALQGHTRRVRSVAFSPDGRTLASCGDDCTVRLCDLKTGQSRALEVRPGHSGVFSVAFSPDGRSLACADSGVSLWDLKTGACEVLKSGFSGHCYSTAFSPDGHTLACAREGRVSLLYDLRIRIRGSQRPSFTDRSLGGPRTANGPIVFSADGSTVAYGCKDSTVCLINLQTGQTRTVEGHSIPIYSTSLLRGHSGPVYAVAFSADRQTLASGSEDRTVRLWNLKTGQSRSLQEHTGAVTSLAFSPDGQALASGSADQTLRLWDLKGGWERAALGSIHPLGDGTCISKRCPRKWHLDPLLGTRAGLVSPAFPGGA